jgi:AcrR family transcriptional regulator
MTMKAQPAFKLPGARRSSAHYHLPMDTIQQLLLGAIDDLAEFGATRFSPVTLCARLKLPPSLVNYHFGSRMSLILDASVLAYEQYVEGQEVALEEATPEGQLAAWIDSQIAWTIKHSGIASVLNFPGLTGPSNSEFTMEHQSRLEQAAVKNMAVLSTIVGRIQGIAQSEELMTQEKIAAHPKVALATAMIGWLTLGHSVWRSGHHIPTSQIPVVKQQTSAVFSAVIPTAISIAKNPAFFAESAGAAKATR